ncbi:hypothetical protein MNV49_000291 [Pseudohyphozyma bogoriensis]|nr:hypothetical protein MNV49_000291 [Pseudohyphozyma bogoriensis]
MAEEHSPLLSSSSRDPRRRPRSPDHHDAAGSLLRAANGGAGEHGYVYDEDADIAIEGMVLVLLAELEGRGYPVPHGLVQPPVDMPPEDLEMEAAVYRQVFAVPRHRDVLNEFLPVRQPPLLDHSVHLASSLASAAPVNPRVAIPTPAASTAPSSSRPSPLSTPTVDSTVLSTPSALFLSGLISLLISLQAEFVGTVQETDRGVDGELRNFKARRDLGERLYAVVGGLLDSYLLAGDERDEDGKDALVQLLFVDFPLNYDSMDRATCAMDLLLNLSSYPLVEAEHLVAHPVVLATTEYVWRNGLMPPPVQGVDATMTWKQSILQIDRFSIPRILQTQTYILSTAHAAITVYILMFSSYTHFDSLNPLSPDAEMSIPEHGRPEKGWSLISMLVWWLWVAGVFGWAGEVARAWHHRGPHPSLPLSPSTLLPLIHHLLVLASVIFRFSLLLMRRPSPLILASSLTMLAWSIPFLAASRVLPQNLPAFGAPTHQKWEKVRDGRKRRDVGYRPPPKSVPESHRALRAIEAHLGGMVQFGNYFAVFGLLLLWSLSGELDYPGVMSTVFFAPLAVLPRLQSPADQLVISTAGQTLSPIEARTTLAFTLVLGVVLAYFAGGRPSVSGKIPSTSGPDQRGLDDLDGWDRYGREVAFRARRERIAVNRYYTFVPPPPRRHPDSVPSAFCTPPLPAPLNLTIPPLLFGAWVCRWFGSEERARMVNERGRLWVWRVGISPLGVWAVLAKSIRRLRGRE